MQYISPKQCPLCKKRPALGMLEISSYWQCKDCKIAWLKQFPKAQYDETYYKGKSSLAQKLFSPIALFFYGIRETYAGIKKINVWIDVGAGEGGFVKTVHSKRKTGVEVSKSGRKMMEEIGLETLTDQQFLKAKGLNADVISFWHVLEHVENPWEYLESAKRNLSKNGKIVVGIPNYTSLEAQTFKKYWFHLVPEYHIWHFSPTSIQKLLEKTGFKIEKIDYWSLEHNPTGVLQSFINWSAHSDSVLHRLIKRGMDYKLSAKDIFWSVFWLTIGLPIVFFFWLAGVLLKMPGTFVVVAVAQVIKSKTRESLH